MKDRPARPPIKHWKLLAILAFVGYAACVLIVTWVFIGGYWLWWSTGWSAGGGVGIVRPFIYIGFGLLFISIGWGVYRHVQLLCSRGTSVARFMKVNFIFLLTVSFSAYCYFGGVFSPGANTPLIALPGANPSSEVMVACYTTGSQRNLVLQYNLKGSGSFNYVLDGGDGYQHRFMLAGLAANSTYEYHLTTNTSSSQAVPSDLWQNQSFKTLNSTGVTFLSISDIHSDFPADLATRMVLENSDLIVQAGDLTGFGSMEGDWTQYFKATQALFNHSDSNLPAPLLLPVIGNHDTLFFGGRFFDRYFKGVGGGAATPLYYRVDTGDIHFIVLDLEWGLETFTSAQRSWLDATLASINPADWIVVITHAPVYSSGFNGVNTELQATLAPIFKTGGVDLVISGHDHHYERIIKDGITYMITGTSSQPDVVSGNQIPNSQAFILGAEIFGKYTIVGNNLTIAGMYANGTVADSAVITH